MRSNAASLTCCNPGCTRADCQVMIQLFITAYESCGLKSPPVEWTCTYLQCMWVANWFISAGSRRTIRHQVQGAMPFYYLWKFSFILCGMSSLNLKEAPASLGKFNPFTPKSDQLQISPAASPEILHYTVQRTWLFHSLLRWKIIILSILSVSLTHFSLKGWEIVLFELGNGTSLICSIRKGRSRRMSFFPRSQ